MYNQQQGSITAGSISCYSANNPGFYNQGGLIAGDIYGEATSTYGIGVRLEWTNNCSVNNITGKGYHPVEMSGSSCEISGSIIEIKP